MSAFAFKCFSPSGSDLCFNSGQCMIDPLTNRQSCKCPAGYGPDNDWFHTPNCARSDIAPIVFLVIGVISYSIIITYTAFRIMPKLRRDLKKLGLVFLVYCVSLFLLGISLYVEGGCYGLCSISSNLCFISALWTGTISTLIVMKPLFAIRMQSIRMFRKILLGCTSVLSFILTATGLTMAVLSYGDDVDSYNIAAFVSIVTLYTAGSLVLGAIIITTTRLHNEISGKRNSMQRNLQGGGPSKDIEPILARIASLRLGAAMVIAPFIVLMITVPTIYPVLGSFPYYYVISYFEYCSTVVFAIGVVYFLRHPPPAKSKPAVLDPSLTSPKAFHPSKSSSNISPVHIVVFPGGQEASE